MHRDANGEEVRLHEVAEWKETEMQEARAQAQGKEGSAWNGAGR